SPTTRLTCSGVTVATRIPVRANLAPVALAPVRSSATTRTWAKTLPPLRTRRSIFLHDRATEEMAGVAGVPHPSQLHDLADAGTVARGLDELQAVDDFVGVHRKRLTLVDGLAHTHVELLVGAACPRHRAGVAVCAQDTPGRLGDHPPVDGAGVLPRHEALFLGIHTVAGEGTSIAQDPKAWPALGGECAHPQVRSEEAHD